MGTPTNKKICLITPDRNDRPEFLEHCVWQMQRQTVKAGDHFVINYPGEEGVVDIVPRIKKGIAMAKAGGFDYCLIIENDDYYPDEYIEKMQRYFDQVSLIGIDSTVLYSLQYPGYRVSAHPGRASLFCTAFKVSEMDRLQWPEDTLLYFDIHLWQHQCHKAFAFLPRGPIGIKHGEGFCPGNFHNGICHGRPMGKFTNDFSYDWLKSYVRKESFDFYKQKMNQL